MNQIKLIILALIFGTQIFKVIFPAFSFKKMGISLVSLFIISVPFELSANISNGNLKTFSGTLGPYTQFTAPMLMLVILLPFVNVLKFSLKENAWIKGVVIMALISLINPFNVKSYGTVVFILYFLSYILLFYTFQRLFDRDQIIKGVYNGLLILCSLQFVLAICFPLLGIKTATQIFHTAAEELATRHGQRDGAVGVFTHPGNLALFLMISSAFFYSSYLNNYFKKQSLFIFLLNSFTLVLTYSRTSYLVYIVEVFSIYYFFTNSNGKIFSLSSILKIGLPTISLIYWVIYYSPLSDYFLNSNIDEMTEVRLLFYYIAFDIFSVSPLIGIGLNTHIEFLSYNNSIVNFFTSNAFVSQNPIHNIHLIVLAETGLIGFFLWTYFIVSGFNKSKKQLFKNKYSNIPLAYMGLLVTYLLYGTTGWAPFSVAILPYFMFFTYFSFASADTKREIVISKPSQLTYEQPRKATSDITKQY